MKGLVVACAAIFAIPSTSCLAYDSSGRVRTEELLARVEFQESLAPDANYINPLELPSWDSAARQRTLALLRRAIIEMPLDIAELPEINKIILSNNSYACPTAAIPKVQEIDKKMQATTDADSKGSVLVDLISVYLHDCSDARWFSSQHELVFSGWYFKESSVDKFPGCLLHEFIHAWEDAHTPDAKSFYKYGYKKREKTWLAIQEAHNRWIRTRLFRRHKDEHIDKYSDKAILIALADKDFAADWQKKLILETIEYRNLDLPARFGPVELGYDKGWEDNHFDEKYDTYKQLDMHAMEPYQYPEYLAILGQLMWTSPSRAREFYSLKEIAWAEHHIFHDRLTLPFSLDKKRASDMNSSATLEKMRVIVPGASNPFE